MSAWRGIYIFCCMSAKAMVCWQLGRARMLLHPGPVSPSKAATSYIQPWIPPWTLSCLLSLWRKLPLHANQFASMDLHTKAYPFIWYVKEMQILPVVLDPLKKVRWVVKFSISATYFYWQIKPERNRSISQGKCNNLTHLPRRHRKIKPPFGFCVCHLICSAKCKLLKYYSTY